MNKPTNEQLDQMRMEMTHEINAKALERVDLEKEHGQVWDTKQLQEDFKVHGFLAPFVQVTRKSDDKTGVLMFQHNPRYYFAFEGME
jgi:hypothetical protein